MKTTVVSAGIRLPRFNATNATSGADGKLHFKDVKPIWGRVANNHFMHACVARPVRKDEIAREELAEKAERKEWGNLRAKYVWAPDVVREFNEVAATARRNNAKVHLGSIFGLMVEKGSELPKGDPRRKYKYRVVFQGNNVIDQNWETAIFQNLGSSLASMEAGKMADAYGSFPGMACNRPMRSKPTSRHTLKVRKLGWSSQRPHGGGQTTSTCSCSITVSPNTNVLSLV